MGRRFSAGFIRLILVLSLFSLVTPAQAASWADGIFREQGHDFGPVPRGAKVRHAFVMTNYTNEALTILDVRASCGCTTGRASTGTLGAGASATVDAEMDTRNFVGRKATVLYVSFISASGRQGEARLNVASTILPDIVLNPGAVDFGTVARGQTAEQSVTIDRVGVPSWSIHKMVSSCRSVDASLTETSRNAGGVSYLLKISLRADAQPGVVRDEIRLLTNDPETPIFPVQISAVIRGDLSASPSVLSLGKVSSNSQAEGRYLVRSGRPFVIRSVEGQSDGFTASVDDRSAKTVHLLTVRYQREAARALGDVRHEFRVLTDLAEEPPLSLTATLSISP